VCLACLLALATPNFTYQKCTPNSHPFSYPRALPSIFVAHCIFPRHTTLQNSLDSEGKLCVASHDIGLPVTMVMWHWVSCYNGHVTTVSLGKIESHEEFVTESYCKTLQHISTHSTGDQLQGKWVSHDDCDTRFPLFWTAQGHTLGKALDSFFFHSLFYVVFSFFAWLSLFNTAQPHGVATVYRNEPFKTRNRGLLQKRPRKDPYWNTQKGTFPKEDRQLTSLAIERIVRSTQ